ncbi:MAG: alpha/beta hydrolase [Flavisolibacter sp.]
MRLSQRLVLKYVRTKFKFLSSLSKRNAAEKAFQLFCTPQRRTKKSIPPVFQKAEKLQFSFEGSMVRGYRWNQSSGKKLLILHGFESSVINFDRFIKPLVQKGYEVLAFDAPAHGSSTGKSINVLAYKNMVLHIIKEFGPVRSFIAHSFGGLSLTLALEQISHDETYKMVLIAPATETKTAIDHFFSILKLDDEVRTEFDRIIEETGGHNAEWFSVARASAHIKASVLFVQDKDDLMTPLTDIEPIISKAYPNFRFLITEGLGHRRIYRDNNVAKEIIDFL